MPTYGVRKTLSAFLKNTKEPVALALSSGIDSSCLLMVLKDLGLSPLCVSFTLDDRTSTDFVGATKIANAFNCEFHPVILSTNADEICSDVQLIANLIHKFKVRPKTTIECLWPYLHVFRFLESRGIKTLVTGNGADGHFGLNKRAMIHFRTPTIKFQMFRSMYFSRPDCAQRQTLTALGSMHGVNVQLPFCDPAMFTLFEDASWDELNKPKQKEAIRQEFPELIPMNIRRHTNMQLGDSGIAEVIGASVIRKFAPSARSPLTVYNKLMRIADD